MCCCNAPSGRHHHGGHGPNQCGCGCHGPMRWDSRHESKSERMDGLAQRLDRLQAQAAEMKNQLDTLKQDS